MKRYVWIIQHSKQFRFIGTQTAQEAIDSCDPRFLTKNFIKTLTQNLFICGVWFFFVGLEIFIKAPYLIANLFFDILRISLENVQLVKKALSMNPT